MKIWIGSSLFAISAVATAQNLIVNGDFSLGNTSFSSDLDYVEPAENALFPEGLYTIVANPNEPINLNLVGTANYFDHTVGDASGAFMVINGSTDTNRIVWSQEVAGLTIGQEYSFGGWFSRWTPNPGPAASIELLVNGVILANFEDPDTAGIWESHFANYVADTTIATLEVRNVSGSTTGNDFGLDDLRFEAVPEPATMLLALGGVAALVTRRAKKLR